MKLFTTKSILMGLLVTMSLSASAGTGEVGSGGLSRFQIPTNSAPNWICENNKAIIMIVQSDTGLKLVATQKNSSKLGDLFFGQLEKKNIMSDARGAKPSLREAVLAISDSFNNGQSQATLDISRGEFSVNEALTNKGLYKTSRLNCVFSTN